MIYAVLGAFCAGAALGAWVTWLVMRPKAVAAAGGPKDAAVKDAVATAGLTAVLEASKAEERIDNATDDELDALVADSVRRELSDK